MRCTRPAPHLTVYFTPRSPALPQDLGSESSGELRSAAAAIRLEHYREAARLLVDRCNADPRLVVPAAECLLLAGDPDAARAVLDRRLPPEGYWPLACARVQQDDLRGALESLATLNRYGLLHNERRVAAAVLAAEVPRDRLPEGLSELADHPPVDVAAARATGYRLFADRAVREIERHDDPREVRRIVECVAARCDVLPARAAWDVLMAVHDAAVRVTPDRELAADALGWVLSRSAFLGTDDAAYSRALRFATVAGRLAELQARLERLAEASSESDARHACRLAAAKISLVRDDPDGIERNADRAVDAAPSDETRDRARGMLRASRWLVPNDGPHFSPWVLRPLHEHVPLAVAECLEDRDGRYLAAFAAHAASSERGRAAAEAASAHLDRAMAIAREPHDRRHLRGELGLWAWHVASAMLESRWPAATEPAAFAEAARRLVEPVPPDGVMATLACALGYAYCGSQDAEPVRGSLDVVVGAMDGVDAPAFVHRVIHEWDWWREGGTAAPDVIDGVAASLRPVSPVLAAPRRLAAAPPPDVDGPPEVQQLIERCFGERLALLPDLAPYRGKRWFDSDEAHRAYQEGRAAKDTLESYQAFQAAWMREPNNNVTIQGLIDGLWRRAHDHPGRIHVLQRESQILNQRIDREVEAALAFRTLAALARPQSQEWRAYLGQAAAALCRRANRDPWTRARNAEIAIQLELGNFDAAGDAAWAEASLRLPGSDASRGYALLAATLWKRSGRADGRVSEADELSLRPPLTNREAVRHAVAIGRLAVLADRELDRESLADLWRACAGDEDEVCRCLEQQASDEARPRPAYFDFLIERIEADGLPGAARLRNLHSTPVDGGSRTAGEPARLAELRLAVAELQVLDPVADLSRSRQALAHVAVRRFLAALRAGTGGDAVAYGKFATGVEDALAALYELRETAPAPQPEPYGGRLARTRSAMDAVRRHAESFADPEIARWAVVVARLLATGLDDATVWDYVREKRLRPAPSRLGLRVGDWWAGLRRGVTGSQDFFHHWQNFQYSGDIPPEDWLQYHTVLGSTARDAIQKLLETLELHTRHLVPIEQAYRRTRKPQEPWMDDLGLETALTSSAEVLRRALAHGASEEDVGAVARTLRGLGDSLRKLDVARLEGTPGVQWEHGLPTGCYLIPRSPELLSHWRNNVRDDLCLRALFEIRDDGSQPVLCMFCLDARPESSTEPTPEVIDLRGQAPFADVVEALGGQLHLWIARPGTRSRCRRNHRDCAADDYVVRIEKRLRELAENRWFSLQPMLNRWLQVVSGALRGRQNATLVFVILPRLHEADA